MFKWERTEYPEVEAITKGIEPYQKLFSIVVKWQRAEKKWMDGAFLELNAETTEAEVSMKLDVFTLWKSLRITFLQKSSIRITPMHHN